MNNDSKWKEILHHHYDGEENCFCIDGYRTSNPNEEGKTIAKIFIDHIEYIDKQAKTDKYAQECINKARKILER